MGLWSSVKSAGSSIKSGVGSAASGVKNSLEKTYEGTKDTFLNPTDWGAALKAGLQSPFGVFRSETDKSSTTATTAPTAADFTAAFAAANPNAQSSTATTYPTTTTTSTNAQESAKTSTPVESASLQDSQLRGAFKDVFDQLNANTTRSNALRSSAANRSAAEQAGLAGYQAGTAEAQRMQDLSAAQANAANVEANQNLISAGTDLAQGQSSQDMTLATKLLDLYGANSPELASALTGAMTSGKDVGQAYQSVLDANGGTLPTTTEGEKAYKTAYDYATRAGLSDSDAKAYAQGQIQQYVNSSAATASQTSQTAAATNAATAVKSGANVLTLDPKAVTQAIVADPSVKTALISQAGAKLTGGETTYNYINQIGGQGLINYKGSPMYVYGGWQNAGTNKDGDTIYKTYAYDYSTGEIVEIKY